MAQLGPVQLLLPHQVDVVRDIDPSDDWLESVVAFGIISGIAGVCALIAYPLTGALSDRTTSRFGRRKPVDPRRRAAVRRLAGHPRPAGQLRRPRHLVVARPSPGSA